MTPQKQPLRIPKDVVDKLNAQIAQENASSFAYLSQAIWCERRGFQGAATFLYEQSEDERAHMLKIIDYLNEMDATVVVPTAQEGVAKTDYPSLHAVFTEVLQNEMTITASIHALVAYTLEVKDYRTFTFLQWFLEEQREEEQLAHRALELFDMMGQDGGVGLYTIDGALADLVAGDEADGA